jgi:hypothetical protein
MRNANHYYLISISHSTGGIKTSFVNKKLPVSKLNLNIENPRFDPVESQDIALEMMVRSGSDEFYNLAKHIADNGLNPSEQPIVFIDADGNYTVKDGNRRVAAIRAIQHPSKISSGNPAYVKRFKLLKEKADCANLRSVQCVIFDDEAEADKWVELKHTGENKGIGTVSWNTLQIERFRAHRNEKESAVLQVYNYIEKNAEGELLGKLQENTFPITNLERLISYPKFRDFVGIGYDDGRVVHNADEEITKKALLKVAKDLAFKEKKVDNIKTTELMDSYIEELKRQSYGATTLTPSTKPIVETHYDHGEPDKKETPKTKKKEKPPTHQRKKVIPEDFSLMIDDARINNIYQELKTIGVDRFPNASSVLFRTFLELSIDVYIENSQVKNITKNSTLINKINRVKDHLIENGIMQPIELQGLTALCNKSNNQPIPMTEQFNGYVHNPYYNPGPGDLKNLWDNLQRFMERIWGTEEY